jgi:hypothetical protein
MGLLIHVKVQQSHQTNGRQPIHFKRIHYQDGILKNRRGHEA